jgi:hypothetical protein
MPQLYFSVDEETADELTVRARQSGQSLSKFLAALVRKQMGRGWPDGYLGSVVASCKDDPIADPTELPTRGVNL